MSNLISTVVNLPIEIGEGKIQTPRGRTITIEPGVEVEVTIVDS